MPADASSKLDFAALLDQGGALLRARWCLRNATRVGERTRVWGSARVTNHGVLEIGDRVRIISTPAITEIGVREGARMTIGSRSFINFGCSISASLSVTIGPRCMIGSHVTLMDNDFHRVEPERRDELPESAPIVLEENVWLGIRSIVLRGVTIGAGSVVAAGSIVSRNVPPRSLVGGIPARLIRSL